MKPLLHAACWLAAWAGGPGWAQVALDQATYVSVGASVLRVEAPRQRGGYAFGSAVAVDRDWVVTNCHVTREATRIDVLRIGLRWTARAQAIALARDLCLLEVPGLDAQPVRWGDAAALAAGQTVHALGYTGGQGLQNSPGAVVQLHRHDGGQVIQSSNWFSSGASGGGLFDGQGALVGILTFRLRGGEAHYFSAPTLWVRELMDQARQGALKPVGPLAAQPVPYWADEPARQPRFLQAALLQRQDRWRELEALASEWSRAEPDDAEPRRLLGLAKQQQGRLDGAQRASDPAAPTQAPERRNPSAP